MAEFTVDDQRFEIIFGSDVQRNGVYLELRRLHSDRVEQLMEIFRKDSTGRITFYADTVEVPFAALARLVARARDEFSATPDA